MVSRKVYSNYGFFGHTIICFPASALTLTCMCVKRSSFKGRNRMLCQCQHFFIPRYLHRHKWYRRPCEVNNLFDPAYFFSPLQFFPTSLPVTWPSFTSSSEPRQINNASVSLQGLPSFLLSSYDINFMSFRLVPGNGVQCLSAKKWKAGRDGRILT